MSAQSCGHMFQWLVVHDDWQKTASRVTRPRPLAGLLPCCWLCPQSTAQETLSCIGSLHKIYPLQETHGTRLWGPYCDARLHK
jgi:hypothetical protein